MEFNSITEFKRNFTRVYHGEVVPALAPFEKKRQDVLRNITTAGIIAAVLIVVVLMTVPSNDLKFGISIVLIIFAFIYSGLQQKSFESNLKKSILPVLLKAFGNLSWSQASVIQPDEIRASGLFSRWDHHDSDDNFYGTYKNSTLRISETELYYYTRDSKGRRQKQTEFKGAIVTIDVGKNFTGHTIVRRREFLLNHKIYEEVKLEDPEFSKQFFVDSNDQIESRVLLTPAFMERFKRIKNSFGARHAECSFKDKKIMIALSTYKDLFVLGSIYKPVEDTTQFTKFLNEIVSIYEMIDYLKVTDKTGL